MGLFVIHRRDVTARVKVPVWLARIGRAAAAACVAVLASRGGGICADARAVLNFYPRCAVGTHGS